MVLHKVSARINRTLHRTV